MRALVVLTAGFAEVGPEGRARQDELLAVCRAAGMRMVGPNCLGVANLHHQTTLNATFAPGELSPGSVAFATQSAAFGIAAIDEAAARGIGLSSFVSMGDKADLSGNDFLEYWEQDPETAVLALYLSVVRQPAPLRAGRAQDHARTSRWSRSRAAARRPASVPRRRAPGRCSPPPTSPSTRCSPTPACCAPRRWGRCSTSRACSRVSRCRVATAWRC